MATARKLPSGAERHRVGLAAEVAGRGLGPGREVDDGEMAGRLGEALAGVDADERVAAGDGDRGRLAVEREDAGGPAPSGR